MSDVRAIGIDAGSTTTKAVGVDAEGRARWHLLEETDPRLRLQIERIITIAREVAGSPAPVVATGHGRRLAAADRSVTEITCHCKGVYTQTGHGGTLIDIGGQDSKVIVVGHTGKVANFAMNDKCAAGTGRFLEVAARRLKLDIDAFSDAALHAERDRDISSTCTVFAESEIVSLIAEGLPVGEIIAGLHRSLVRRVGALVRSTGLEKPVMLSGGVAQNAAVRRFLGEELDVEVVVPEHPQLMGAYGAALIALESLSVR
ncbi:MAG: 2-hydroxyglutaryl-CoA dehydratase [Gemmatimonadetes bacterium]|nr:2-hydroxyglutaryl-CoA dehydratase [Gemmatimonadota bacterium]